MIKPGPSHDQVSDLACIPYDFSRVLQVHYHQPGPPEDPLQFPEYTMVLVFNSELGTLNP